MIAKEPNPIATAGSTASDRNMVGLFRRFFEIFPAPPVFTWYNGQNELTKQM